MSANVHDFGFGKGFFSKEDTQIPIKHTNRCSKPLAIKEMQIKAMRHHFTLNRMAIIKDQFKKGLGKDGERPQPLYTAGGNVK